MKQIDPSELNNAQPVANDTVQQPVVRLYQVSGSDPTASNPLHANITPSPRHTPDPVRIGLAIWSARYVFRGLFRTMTKTSSPEIFQAPVHPLREAFARPIFDKINDRLAKVDFHELFGGKIPEDLTDIDAIEHAMRNTPAGNQLKKDIRVMLKPWEASGLVNNTIQHAIEENAINSARTGKEAALKITNTSKGFIKSHMSESLFAFLYDNTISAGSFTMTAAITKRVRRDINNMYAEAVGYELGKDPNQIDMNDISNSGNEIIQSSFRNYRSKLGQRLGISAFPLLKNIPSLRALELGDIALGMWGVQWAFDVWGREPTMLELFSDFVNDKLNPTGGIGDPIKTSDVIQLYQHAAFKFHPDQAFKSVRNNPGEIRMWERSQKVFDRVAQLMNDSYNFKHTAITDPNTGQPLGFANFTFPKFIYLLGHNLIDAHKPDWSMAYIEIANAYGMEAVKDVQRMQESGRALSEIVQDYSVDLNPNKNPGLLKVAENLEQADHTEHGIPVVAEVPEAQVSAADLAAQGQVVAAPHRDTHIN